MVVVFLINLYKEKEMKLLLSLVLSIFILLPNYLTATVIHDVDQVAFKRGPDDKPQGHRGGGRGGKMDKPRGPEDRNCGCKRGRDVPRGMED